nr:hypothetical protein [Tanacetum cinerariifolium]
MKDLQAHALKQEEASAAWTKSSTNMAWNFGSRMTTVEISQTALKREVSSLRQDTSEIKSMMVEIYQAFRDQSSSAPSGSVTPTLALTHIPAYFERENATNTATKEPPFHTDGETEDPKMAITISSIQPTKVLPSQAQPITTIITHPESSQAASSIDKGKGIATETGEDPSKKLVPASTIIRLDPDEPVKVKFIINGRMVYLTEQEIQEYRDKEEKMKKAAKEAKLLTKSNPEVIKVVREEAKKLRINPKEVVSTKAGEKFKKALDAEHEVLKREHSKKVKRITNLNKRRAEEYMWTMTNRIKPEPIIDIKIYPNTKPVVVSVFQNNNKRNFDVQNPFKYTDFGINELDELGLVIQKKKNSIVKDPMTSLCKRYERLKKIPEEPGIQYALPAPAFQRWDDIHKVRVDSLVSYLVMASMVKTEENARFSLKLRKLITDYPDQQKLKSKKMIGSCNRINEVLFVITSGDDEQALQRAKNLFHSAFADMEKSGCKEINLISLADTFKLQGNKAVESKLYPEAIELYTVAIALRGDNAIYHCNRAAAYTRFNQDAEAIIDCQNAIAIDPKYIKAYSASVKEHDEARIDLRFKKMNKSQTISNANRPKIDGDMQYFVDIHDYQRSFMIVYDNAFLELYILPKRDNVSKSSAGEASTAAAPKTRPERSSHAMGTLV